MTVTVAPGGHVEASLWRWPERAGGRVRLFALTVLAYSTGSQLALWLIEMSELESVFFIPAGVTVAFLLRLARRFWWVVVLAAALSEATMDLLAGYSLGSTAGFVAANAVEPVVGALIVTSVCPAPDLARLRHVWWYIVGAVLVGPMVGAAVGSVPAGLLGGSRFAVQFWQWWLGDALGVILVGTAILVWGSSPDRRSLRSMWGASLIAGTLLLTIGVINVTNLPLLFVVLIGVTVAGAIFGVRAVAVTALLVAATIALDLAFGPGRVVLAFAEGTALVIIKLQLTIFTAAGLVVAAQAHELEVAGAVAAEAGARAMVIEAERRLERQIAGRLQHAFRPEPPPDLSWLAISARYEAGSEGLLIGGDWYDVLTLADGRVAITVGDVAGHGLEAAVSMGRLRTAAAALAPHSPTPAHLLVNLDAYSYATEATDFATVAYFVVDRDSGTMVYASAGHPPILVCEPSGRTRWLQDGRSRPLIGRPLDQREEASVRLEPGTLIVLYTDGLIERRDEDIDVGLRRLEREVTRVAGKEPAEVCDHLIGEMGVGHIRTDDVVVLVARYRP